MLSRCHFIAPLWPDLGEQAAFGRSYEMMRDGSGCNCPAGRVMWLNDESGTPVAACVQVSISHPVALFDG